MNIFQIHMCHFSFALLQSMLSNWNEQKIHLIGETEQTFLCVIRIEARALYFLEKQWNKSKQFYTREDKTRGTSNRFLERILQFKSELLEIRLAISNNIMFNLNRIFGKMIDVFLNQIENLNQQQLILISIFQPKLLDFFYFNKKQL